MQDSLSGRAAELAHLTDLIRTSLFLADAAIPLINEQLNGLAEMGIDNLELEGPRIYSRTAGWSPAFADEQMIYAAALTMAGGLGSTTWNADEYAMRYGDSHHTRCPGVQTPGSRGTAALCGCYGYASATAQGWTVRRRKPDLVFGSVLGGRSADTPFVAQCSASVTPKLAV